MREEVTIPGLGWRLNSDKDYQAAFVYLIQTGWQFKVVADEDYYYAMGIEIKAPIMLRDYFNLDPRDYDSYVGVTEFQEDHVSIDKAFEVAFDEAIVNALNNIGDIWFDNLTQSNNFKISFLDAYHQTRSKYESII